MSLAQCWERPVLWRAFRHKVWLLRRGRTYGQLLRLKTYAHQIDRSLKCLYLLERSR